MFIILLSVCGAAQAQKVPVSWHFADSLLGADPFQHPDSSSLITIGVPWDRVVPNIYLPAVQNGVEDNEVVMESTNHYGELIGLFF